VKFILTSQKTVEKNSKDKQYVSRHITIFTVPKITFLALYHCHYCTFYLSNRPSRHFQSHL